MKKEQGKEKVEPEIPAIGGPLFKLMLQLREWGVTEDMLARRLETGVFKDIFNPDANLEKRRFEWREAFGLNDKPQFEFVVDYGLSKEKMLEDAQIKNVVGDISGWIMASVKGRLLLEGQIIPAICDFEEEYMQYNSDFDPHGIRWSDAKLEHLLAFAATHPDMLEYRNRYPVFARGFRQKTKPDPTNIRMPCIFLDLPKRTMLRMFHPLTEDHRPQSHILRVRLKEQLG